MIGYPTEKVNIATCLEKLLNGIIAIIPMVTAFYYFIYREQKAVSESSLYSNKFNIKYFIAIYICLLANLVYYNQLYNVSGINFFNLIESTPWTMTCFVMFLISFVTTSVWLLFRIIIYFGSGINVRSLLTRVRKDFKIYCQNIRFLSNRTQGSGRIERVIEHIRIENYEQMDNCIESFYQCQVQAINKDMISVFDEECVEWNKIINSFWTKENVQLLLKIDSKNFLKVYKSILKNHLSLITVLYTKNKLQEGYRAIKELLKLGSVDFLVCSEEDEVECKEYRDMTEAYFTVLSELSLWLYKNDNIGLQPVIQNIKQMPIHIGLQEILTTFRLLLIKAVEKNDCKLVVNLSYSMGTIADYSMGVKKKPEKKHRTKTKKSNIAEFESILHVADQLQQQPVDIDLQKDFQGKFIYVLISAAIKSIELGHNSCAGFLIKYISNHDGHLILNSYKKNDRNRGEDILLDRCRWANQLGINSFNINSQTFTYCLGKLEFLLYGQQKYLKEKGLKITVKERTHHYIELEHLTNERIDHFYVKFTNSSKDYGLVYLEKSELLSSLVDELKAKIVKSKGKVSDLKNTSEEDFQEVCS